VAKSKICNPEDGTGREKAEERPQRERKGRMGEWGKGGIERGYDAGENAHEQPEGKHSIKIKIVR